MCGRSNQGFLCGIFNFPDLAIYYSAVIFTLLADNVAWPIDCTLTYLLTYPTGGLYDGHSAHFTVAK